MIIIEIKTLLHVAAVQEAFLAQMLAQFTLADEEEDW